MSEELIWDSPAWRKQRDGSLLRWMRGNHDAMRCVMSLGTVSEVWDDLIDKDKPLTEEHIHSGMMSALVFLNENPFWQAHSARFMPVIIVGINAWMDANELEKDPTKKARALAFYIRNYFYEVSSVGAYCAGGWQWLRSVSLEMRMFFQHESYFTWEKRI